MARFEVGVAQKTRVPGIEVDAGMAPGLHRFRLEVATADGRTSAPAEAVVQILRGAVDPDPRDRVTGPVVPTPVPRDPIPR